MTQLQVDFQKVQEQKRANQVQEYLKGRDTTAKEREAAVKELLASIDLMEAKTHGRQADIAAYKARNEAIQGLLGAVQRIGPDFAGMMDKNASSTDHSASAFNKMVGAISSIMGKGGK